MRRHGQALMVAAVAAVVVATAFRPAPPVTRGSAPDAPRPDRVTVASGVELRSGSGHPLPIDGRRWS